ncbi:MAG: hypothetical protein R3256_00220 [Thalassovita sp.]|nr:hypothetical protein [Thalassovita sp.]
MSAKPTCQRCQWFRAFLGTGFGLIVLIWLQPDGAKIIAGLMPAPFTLAVGGMVLGSMAFLFRLWVWARLAKQG